jgi:hypothetical protein
MKYEVRCACGKAHAVSAADAGSALRCACGRTVEVPALHVLRTTAGENPLSPAFRLEALLLEGKLPGTRTCAVCRRDTDGLIRVSIVCERGSSSPDGSSRDDHASEGLGCLLGSIVGWAGPWDDRSQEGHTPSRQLGQDVAFVVPLPVCEPCRPQVAEAGALRQAIRSVPIYADVLDKYPNALLAPAG